MNNNKYIYIHDGDLLNNGIDDYGNNVILKNVIDEKKLDFCTNRIGESTTINYVGFIILKSCIIVSFPKKYKINNFKRDRELLWLFIRTLQMKDNNTFLDNSNDYDGKFFPLKAYSDVLKYYLLNGLYKVELHPYNHNNKGRISWSHTFRRSPKSINKKGEIIFKNFYRKDTVKKDNIISELMEFVLSDGYNHFGKYFNFGINYNYRFKNINKSKCIYVLKKKKNESNKDTEKNLFQNIINYLKWYDNNLSGIYFGTINFQSIWEKITRDFLNSRIVDIVKFINNNTDEQIDEHLNDIKFKKVKQLYGKDADYTYRYGEYDDLCITNQNIFIFDAKYYNKFESLDYKQIVYHMFISGANRDNTNGLISESDVLNKKKINCLILPSSENMKIESMIDMRYMSEINFGFEIFSDLQIYLLYMPIKIILNYSIEKFN